MRSLRRSALLAGAVALVGLAACDAAPFAPSSAPGPPASVRIDDAVPLLLEGDSARFTVRVLDAANQPIRIPAFAPPRWSAESPAVGVRGDGTVTAESAGDAVVRVEVAGLSAARSLRVDPHVITMRVEGAYLVQAVQRLDGTIPLVAGRDALLRVFVVGNKAFNDYRPPVRAYLYHDDTRVHEMTIPAGQRISHELSQGFIDLSWNAPVPGHLVQPGLGLRVVADPEHTVERTAESVAVFPADGGIETLDVRPLPAHRIRFVPVRQTGTGTVGNVTEENAHGYVDLFQRIFPVPDVEVEVRPTYTTGAEVAATDGWLQLLEEMSALRAADGSSAYYYGVVRPAGGSWGGFGYIGYPVAVGYDRLDRTSGGWSWAAALFAHELGHNFGRRHAPCGNAAGVDPGYPYPGAVIGVYGYDLVRQTILSAMGARDIMSYCYDWISDYTYEAVWNFREREAGVAAAAPTMPGRGLLVWGRIDPDGELHLEPAFELDDVVTTPPAPGPYLVEAFDDDGRRLFSRSFAGEEVAHTGGIRLFAFAVSLDGIGTGAIHRLRLSGPARATERVAARDLRARLPEVARSTAQRGVRLEWDARQHPAAIVRDAATGVILAIPRHGRVRLPDTVGPVQVLLSHGTGSVAAPVAER